jgi:hypothetical protein
MLPVLLVLQQWRQAMLVQAQIFHMCPQQLQLAMLQRVRWRVGQVLQLLQRVVGWAQVLPRAVVVLLPLLLPPASQQLLNLQWVIQAWMPGAYCWLLMGECCVLV